MTWIHSGTGYTRSPMSGRPVTCAFAVFAMGAFQDRDRYVVASRVCAARLEARTTSLEFVLVNLAVSITINYDETSLRTGQDRRIKASEPQDSNSN
jgi:hypothetical protein